MIFQGRSKTVFVSVTVMFILATLLVIARIVSRFFIVRRHGWDDYFIVLAWILAFGISFAIDFSTSRGLGLQQSDIPTPDDPLLKAEYAAIVLYNPALMATKSSILIFFIGIARDTQQFLRIGSYVTLVVVNVGGIVLSFITIFQCRPVQAAYNLAIPNARCISFEAIYLASVPVNVVTDLAILVLPIPILTGINLPWRQKAILVLTFLTGVFVTVVDVVRIYYVQLAATRLNEFTGVSITSSLKLSYNISLALLWSAVEVNVGIICACIPTLKPLIKLLALTKAKRSDHAPSSEEQPPVATQDLQSINTSPLTENQEQHITEIRDFITTPYMNLEMEPEPTPRPPQQDEYAMYFGFINMRQPKCMLDIQGLESVKYCAIIFIIFFLWGSSYTLVISLTSVIPLVGIRNPYQLMGIPSANFLGYLVSPFLTLWVLRHHGFKVTFATGLGIYCVGTIMFYPSGALKSYSGIIVCNFVLGFSQSILRTTSIIFTALCGPPQYSEIRLLIGEGVAALARVLSTLLTQKVFMKVADNQSLIAIQWTYLSIALFSVLIALFFYYMPLPEASDSDLQRQAERLWTQSSQKRPIFTTLIIAILSSVFLSGAGQALGIFLPNIISSASAMTATSAVLKAADFFLVGATIYAVDGFVFALLCLLIPPRILLLISYIGAIAFTALLMGLDFSSANEALAVALAFIIFEGPIFALTWTIALRGLGRWTKLAACLITAGNAIGSIVSPYIMLAMLQSHSAQYSFCIVVSFYAAGAIFPLYINLYGAARHQADPIALSVTTSTSRAAV